ncbi:glycerate kinase, partial [Acidimicrobiaceae bacterium]|nr:glycerate kinase [Acidimicrobiaceae bacterium]
VDVESVVGAGAAGGLGGGLVALGANIVSGFDLIADELGLFEKIEQADVVITGEGRLDAESFDGKVVGGVAEMAAEVGARLIVVAGEVSESAAAFDLGVDGVAISLTDRVGRQAALAEPVTSSADAVAELLAVIR